MGNSFDVNVEEVALRKIKKKKRKEEEEEEEEEEKNDPMYINTSRETRGNRFPPLSLPSSPGYWLVFFINVNARLRLINEANNSCRLM